MRISPGLRSSVICRTCAPTTAGASLTSVPSSSATRSATGAIESRWSRSTGRPRCETSTTRAWRRRKLLDRFECGRMRVSSATRGGVSRMVCSSGTLRSARSSTAGSRRRGRRASPAQRWCACWKRGRHARRPSSPELMRRAARCQSGTNATQVRSCSTEFRLSAARYRPTRFVASRWWRTRYRRRAITRNTIVHSDRPVQGIATPSSTAGPPSSRARTAMTVTGGWFCVRSPAASSALWRLGRSCLRRTSGQKNGRMPATWAVSGSLVARPIVA